MVDKNLLKTVIADQRIASESLFSSGKIIEREGIDICTRYLAQPNVVLISGLRRCGKSVFAHQLARFGRYAHISFDDERLLGMRAGDLQTMVEAFHELQGPVDCYVFDEIQNIEGWELFIGRLRQNRRIIITGSNAHLLSSEMATHLTGRFDVWTLFPMSFREFLGYRALPLPDRRGLGTEQKSAITATFSEYCRCGGLFEYYSLGRDHIRTMVWSIVARDILTRYRVEHTTMLNELASLLIQSFSAKISIQKLSARLGARSPHTIKDYTSYLQNAFIVHPLLKYSTKLSEQQSSFKKMYVTDNGIIESVIVEFSPNRGRFLENCIAIELWRRSTRDRSEMYYWDDNAHECDFVIKLGQRITNCMQACQVLTPDNEKREIAGLCAALKSFGLSEGIILTEDQQATRTVHDCTVHIMPAWQWLIG